MSNVGLSKSKYVTFINCPKCLWLDIYKPELAEIDEGAKERMATGNEVGDFAMGLFGPFVEVTEKEDDKLNIPKMLERTKDEISKGTNVICEASFSYNGCYCAVDILKKENDGYAIYEVKSSTDVRPYHIWDISYQKYVLGHCGINVSGTYIVIINNQYVRNGALNIQQLFKIIDVKDDIKEYESVVPQKLKEALDLIGKTDEPDTALSEQCKECRYRGYCMKDVPDESVFDIYSIRFKTALKYYEEGIKTFEDALINDIKLNEKQKRQVEFSVKNKNGTYVDKERVKEFLETLSYPLYFLDFETMQLPIPEYDGTRPYQVLPFQYSLHYIEKEGGELKHKEFLAESGKNPLEEIANSLCNEIPKGVCVTAFNKSFECTRIKELAKMFPELSEQLLNISNDMKDFLDPFKDGDVYNKNMGGSFSIKSVLPALFPDNSELNYHNLTGDVHNGGEASSLFPKIKDMPIEEQVKARKDLLEYCGLDTYAMVKVWEKLIELSK